jgi:predicted nuclease of predicted toxin-antitoxin system
MNGRVADRILYLPSSNPNQEFRLHLDENISSAIADMLRGRGYDVTTTSDVGLRAQPDAHHMRYAVEQQRIIVTRDRDFLQLHAQDQEHSGIVYWPHNESATLGDMQDLLVRLLSRVSESPTRRTEILTCTPAEPVRGKKRKKQKKKKPHQPPPSNRLPRGLLVRGVVQSVHNHALEVQLETRQIGRILPHRLPEEMPSVGTEIEAVTVGYIKRRKQLHLSMRRLFSLARTVPAVGVKQLRRDDYALIRTMELCWPAEVELEDEYTVRIFGRTAEAVRTAAQYLQQQIPWTASVTVQLDRPRFQQWMRKAFGGGVGSMSRATGTLVRYHDAHSLLLCAISNRELNALLQQIQKHVPGLQVRTLQSARSEPLMPCRWETPGE